MTATCSSIPPKSPTFEDGCFAIPTEDRAAIAERFSALRRDLDPGDAIQSLMVHLIASNSVRLDRCDRDEVARLARQAALAGEAFDERRRVEAEALLSRFDEVCPEARAIRRNLLKTPEGVDLLLEKFRGLLRGLNAGWWTYRDGEMAVVYSGRKEKESPQPRLLLMSNGSLGFFGLLLKTDGGDLDKESRMEWCKGELRRLLTEEIAILEAHRETIDFDRIARERAEAVANPPFDTSKEAVLARQYQQATLRSMFRGIKELRAFKREAAQAPKPIEAEPAPLGSSRAEEVASVGADGLASSRAEGTPPNPDADLGSFRAGGLGSFRARGSSGLDSAPAGSDGLPRPSAGCDNDRHRPIPGGIAP